jgi:hypothetical protein
LGTSASVVGGSLTIAGGVLTVTTGGLAAPLLVNYLHQSFSLEGQSFDPKCSFGANYDFKKFDLKVKI